MLLFIAVVLSILIVLFCVLRNNTKKYETVQLGIIMYHDVNTYSSASCDYLISTSMLEDDLIKYQASNWKIVSLSAVLDYVKGTGSLPEKSLLLVFDDGFISLQTDVLPLLVKYNVPAVVSVIGARAMGIAYDNDTAEAGYLTWDELANIAKSGLLEYQYHSMNLHVYGDRKGVQRLTCESDAEYCELIKNDIETFQTAVQEKGLKFLPSFAYPYGIVDPTADKTLAENGILCTMNSGEYINLITKNDPNCLYQLGSFNRSGCITTDDVMFFLGN